MKFLAATFCLLLSLPFLNFIFQISHVEFALLSQIATYLGVAFLTHTFLYGIIIIAGSVCLGFFWGYLTTHYNFYGKAWGQWLLATPLCIPSYIYSFLILSIWSDFISLDKPHWLIVLIMITVTFPYSYFLAKLFFKRFPVQLSQASSFMGLTYWQKMSKISLPLALPTIFSSSMIVFLEYLSDFGAVDIFDLHTPSTMIYRLWNQYFSFASASFLALLLFIFCFVLSSLQNTISQWKDTNPHNSQAPKNSQYSPVITVLCYLQITITFLFPIFYLCHLSFKSVPSFSMAEYHNFLYSLIHTIGLSAFFSIVCTLTVGLLVSRSNRGSRKLLQSFTFGYGLPGTVIALATLSCFYLVMNHFSVTLNTVLLGIILLFYGWFIRFFRLPWSDLRLAKDQQGQSIPEQARLMGLSQWQVLKNIDYPQLKSSLYLGAGLVFIETVKELPIALMTRPSQIRFLSIDVYEYTAESMWNQAAPYALVIVLISMSGLRLVMKRDL